MKNSKVLISILIAAALIIGAAAGWLMASQTGGIEGNHSDEMKMSYRTNFADGGPNAVERNGDHKDSPYFYKADFYNAQPGDGLYILPKFQTIQQTSWWSCGVSCTEMVLNYFGKRGDWNEEKLAAMREDHEDLHIGTCLDQIIDMFDAVGGFELETTYDYEDNLDTINMAFIREHIAAGTPIVVGWNDWGGHWQVIIGYDTMGTEYEGDDVIIVADPFDTTDHNQDGYGVYGVERFIYNFTFYDFFGDSPNHLRNKCFVAVRLAETSGVDASAELIGLPETPVITEAPEQATVIYPLADNTMDNLSDAILSISLEEGDVYVDDIGEIQMDVKIYSYDKYDMVDISMLKVGDIIVGHAGELEINSMDRKDNGSIAINGGLDAGGFELITENNGIFYEQGYNDAKNWYQVGEATICVSADFEYHDYSDLDNGEVLHYSDGFIDGGVTDYFFSPHNTTIRVEGGQIVEMNRVYTP